MGYASLLLANKPVVVVKPIEATDFEDIGGLTALAARQGLAEVVVTKEAWSKYEKLLEPITDATYTLELGE